VPRFVFLQPPRSSANSITFEEFLGITKGRTISSAAASTKESRGPDFLELGLSKTFNLNIRADGDKLVVSLVSTLNKGDFTPVLLEIIGKDETVTVELLERRLHHLRQIYAITFLVEAGRETDVASLLRDYPSADLEHDLVAEKDKLVIVEATPGSLILSLIATSKRAYQALLYTCAVPFAQGREALLGRVTAGTALAKLEVQAKTQDIRLKGANGVIDLAKKIESIKDEDTRELIRKRLFAEMDGLTSSEVPASKTPAIAHSPDLGSPLVIDNPPSPVQSSDERKRKVARPKKQGAKN
jgi:hypothetical protein